MNTQGGLCKHRGLIALTGAFIAVVALSGCHHEKPINPQGGNISLPGEQTVIAFQKKEPLTAGQQDVVASVLLGAIKTKAAHAAQHASAANHSSMRSASELPLSAPHTTQCWIGDVAAPLREVVTGLEEQSLLYNTGPLTDCSGIFHRVLQGLKQRCPARDFPSVDEYRDSRALARWYHEHGKLQLIKDAEESTDLLKPGAILFFGRNGSEYKDFSVDDLLIPRKGITHIGVVVKVHKDESGRLLHYELFHGHGRKGITAASVTDWHKRTPTRTGYPPFGNGRQQLVAVARI